MTLPVVFWVVGTGPNVGKTAVATALITYLNKRGIPTIGFKPYAAMQLQDSIDMLLGNFRTAGVRLCGSDAQTHCSLSYASAELSAEVIDPILFVCHPGWKSVILARTGSTMLGDVEFFKGAGADRLLQRDDLSRLLDGLEIPFDSLKAGQSLNFYFAGATTPEKPRRAFQYICDRQPKAVVVEGAGNLLPTWLDSPPAQHVFILSDGLVALHAQLSITVPFNATKAIPRTDMLLQTLRERKRRAYLAPLYLVEKSRREEVLHNTLEALFRSADLVFPS